MELHDFCCDVLLQASMVNDENSAVRGWRCQSSRIAGRNGRRKRRWRRWCVCQNVSNGFTGGIEKGKILYPPDTTAFHQPLNGLERVFPGFMYMQSYLARMVGGLRITKIINDFGFSVFKWRCFHLSPQNRCPDFNLKNGIWPID